MCRAASIVSILLATIFLTRFAAGAVEQPTAVDERLAIELFAAEPDLVTPTGIAVDAQGRVLVVESHTHFRPDDYDGPEADRIRVFEDTKGDGRADRISTFYEGTRSTMNVAVHHDGSVYVATRSEIFRLRDTNQDGAADERVNIATLDTPGDYPHNGLSGFAFDFAGNVYFGLGENLGAQYRLIGSDGAELAGGGEGGNIYRCGPDGSGLARVATGFWNPFHLAFDVYGRLFAVDNDPDSRPPCRLLEIVPGGDYGYRFRNGRKGLHPLTAWNGELPGTLPMVAGTGEAPSGIVAYESDNLPGDFRGSLLVTSWGDHRLERYRLVTQGASFTATGEAFVTGGEDFRPVGIAVAPDGTLFVSDWVDKSYTLHGKGRIWRVRAKAAAEPKRPSKPRAAIASPHRELRESAARKLAAEGESGQERLRRIITQSAEPRMRAAAISALAATHNSHWFDASWLPFLQSDEGLLELALRELPPDQLEQVAGALPNASPRVRAVVLRRTQSDRLAPLAGLRDPDPFIRQAALVGLEQSATVAELATYATHDDAAVRLGSLLALRNLNSPECRAGLDRFLEDADPAIRFAAVQWVGEARLAEYRTRVESILAQAATRQLFEGCLAALELLDRTGPLPDPSNEIAGEEYVARVLVDPRTSAAVRQRALRMLRADHPAVTLGLLDELYDRADPGLRLEVVRTLRESPLSAAAERLRSVAAETDLPTTLRAEAVVGLVPDGAQSQALLLQLAGANDPELRDEALRSLRGASLSTTEGQSLRDMARGDPETVQLVEKVLSPPAEAAGTLSEPTPAVEHWLPLLAGPADPAAGARIFFHSRSAGCYRCHQLDGRGGRIGPELSSAAPHLDRRRLIESIVEPSKEIAPRFVTWSIIKTDGTALTGMLVGEGAGGEQTYANSRGELVVLQPDEIERREPQPISIMPANLAQTLTPREFRDLLAFLLGAP